MTAKLAPPDAAHRPGLPGYVLAVAGFGVLLVLQSAVSFLVKPEPFPTIRMPDFGSAASRDGTVRVSVARLEAVGADGSVREVSVSELMRTFRFSAARPSYDHLFRRTDPATLSPADRSWLRARIDSVTDGFRATEVRMCWQDDDVSVVDASTVSAPPCTWKVIRL